MNIAVSISASCLIYAILLKLAILMFNIPLYMKPDTYVPCFS